MHKKTVFDLNRPSLEEYRAAGKLPLTLVLDNIRSLNNIGSMMRTADAFLVERVMLCGVSGTPPSPEIHKTALGAEDSVCWEYFPSTMEAIDRLRREATTICVLEQVEGSVPLQDFPADPRSRYAIVVGHEVEGVSQEVVDAADVCLEIPQHGTKHSLNVAVTAALALWHFYLHLHN